MAAQRKRLNYPLLLVVIFLLSSGSTIGERFDYYISRSRIRPSGAQVISMVFAGDIMAHDVNYLRKPYDPIYEGIRDLIWEADLSFANLEFVFDPGEPPSSYPYFNAPVAYVEAAVNGGFNVFSLSNNHSLDIGGDSVLKTLAIMEDMSKHHRLYYNGISATAVERFAPFFFDVSGVRVGFLAVTSFLNRLENDEHVNVVPYYDSTAIDVFVKQLAAEARKADLFVLSYHGGGEYRREPEQWKRDLFRRFVDVGVDIVWGHHPHVIQPWETVNTKAGNKLILYSTGNLISGQTWTSGPDAENVGRNGTGESALFTMEALVHGDNVSLGRVTVVPIFNYRDPKAGMVIRRFDRIASVEMSDVWALYYKERLLDLETRLYDSSSWDFVR